MPKKLRELANETPETQLAAKVKNSANQIWLAGLGAFAKAQQEGVKMFEALVAEGERFRSGPRRPPMSESPRWHEGDRNMGQTRAGVRGARGASVAQPERAKPEGCRRAVAAGSPN